MHARACSAAGSRAHSITRTPVRGRSCAAHAPCASPLPARHRSLPAAGVFFGSDFVTVTKSDGLSWPVLKPDVFAAIMDHFSSGAPLFSDAAALAASDTAIHEDDDEVRSGARSLPGGLAGWPQLHA